MNTLAIETDWRQLKGSHSFFDVTKKFHNALQGERMLKKTTDIIFLPIQDNLLPPLRKVIF